MARAQERRAVCVCVWGFSAGPSRALGAGSAAAAGQVGVGGGACGDAPQESLAKAARRLAEGEDSIRIRVLRAGGMGGIMIFLSLILKFPVIVGVGGGGLSCTARALQCFIPLHHMM